METKRIKVLAIDDNHDNLIVLGALLVEVFPFVQLLTARSGKIGIELCQKHKPDLVLLDIVMPIMDGYEVCETLKNDERLKHIPIVMVTAARTDKAGRIKALESGADGFLTKPLDESELKAQVRAMIRIKESEDRKLDEKERLEKLVEDRTAALETELEERKKAEKRLQTSYIKLQQSKQEVLNLMKDLEVEMEERKRVEILQNNTNKKYAEAQRIAHIGSWEDQLLTGELQWSAEMYQIFGIVPGTSLRLNEVKKYFPPDEMIRFDQALVATLEENKPYSIDYKIIRPDGEVRYIHDQGEVIRDRNGKPVLMVGTSHDITERKLAEIALKENEEHFKMLFENAPVGYQSLDASGNFVDVNETWLEIMGYPRNEVIGKWFGSFLAPEFVEVFRARFPLFKEWGKVHSEFEMITKDGNRIFIAFDGRIGHTLSGEFKQTHCVIKDITEQRRAEQELKQSYDFNNSLLKTIPFGMDIVDEEGNVLFQNEKSKKYFGSEELGKKCWDLYRDDKTKCKDCPLNKGITIGETYVLESFGIAGGKTFEISHTGMMYKGKKAMLGIFQDVTQRKRTELIQKVLYAISHAVITTKNVEELSGVIKEQLGQLLDTTNFYIASYDEATDMLTSQYFADQKDFISSWPAKKSMTGYVIKHNKSLIVTKDEVLEMRRTGEIDLVGSASEIWLGVPLHEEGKVIGAFVLQSYVDVNAFTSKDLELLEFISHQISISIQRKRSLQDLMEALAKAKESEHLKTAFLSNMSHEIRTPMNGILGFSELLDDDTLSNKERRRYLDIINTNGQHLLSIINDVLDIAKIDSNQLVINKIPFNLHQLLDELFVSYENNKVAIGKEHLRFLLEKEFGDNNCTIICDEVRLRQILYNLLGNALKFTQNGFIKFGYKLSDEKLLFFVQDTGKGISKEMQTIVFDRFRQEEESYTRQFGGTGLGLSISKKLVELLGGEMWLVSEQGIGTTFYFTIPFTMITFGQ